MKREKYDRGLMALDADDLDTMFPRRLSTSGIMLYEMKYLGCNDSGLMNPLSSCTVTTSVLKLRPDPSVLEYTSAALLGLNTHKLCVVHGSMRATKVLY